MKLASFRIYSTTEAFFYQIPLFVLKNIRYCLHDFVFCTMIRTEILKTEGRLNEFDQEYADMDNANQSMLIFYVGV